MLDVPALPRFEHLGVASCGAWTLCVHLKGKLTPCCDMAMLTEPFPTQYQYLLMERDMESDRWDSGTTVKAHSSGPEVDKGRCPNLACLVSFGWSDILRLWRALNRYTLWSGWRMGISLVERNCGIEIVHGENRIEQNWKRKTRVVWT